MRVEDCLTQWTVIVGSTPLFDAWTVEVVAFVTRQGRHRVRILEGHQADHTLLMLTKLVEVKHSGHLGKVLIRILSLEALLVVDSCLSDGIGVLAAEWVCVATAAHGETD